ncbi:MAG: GreA/GreB family elongation factor [Verrucomicrobiia bacterium]|jgi:transcription elongation factor GreA-like protein/transcription elongation GreA/GreB family factor
MSSIQNHHQQLKDFLSRSDWDNAQALWLELAEQFSDQPEFLLLLVKEFADAGQTEMAAELASLIAESIKAAGKHHEWLYALKLQAEAKPTDKPLRAELLSAYSQLHESDPRLRAILTVSDLDQNRTPLPTAIARIETLLALQVGTYCQHKSWGVGRVKSFDATLGQIVVSFAHNPSHSMKLAYAAESLAPVSIDHIEVRKLTDLDGLKRMAAEDPVAALRLVLLSHHRAATPERIEGLLSGSVIPADQWKKWWENARKLLKKDPHFDLPAKKTDPVILRTAPVSQQDEILEAFRDAKGLAQQTEVARQFLKLVDELEDAELLIQEFQDALLESLKRTPASRPVERIEAAVVLEQLREHQKSPTEDTAVLLARLLSASPHLSEVLDELSTSAQRRALAVLKITDPDRLLRELNRFSTRSLDEIPDVLAQKADAIEQWVHNQTAGTELLCWICRNISTPASRKAHPWLDALQTPALLFAVIESIESAPNKSVSKKLRDVLFGEEELVADLLVQADTETVRKITRLILSSSAFEELDRRSLVARVVKVHPFVQEFLVTKTVKEQPLIVSWGSYNKRRAELDDIIQKKIPQNSKEIGLARSYGDLRENFEFKAAKDMQRLLMRRRAELEILLSRAQPTDFADAKTDIVSIGTSVTVTDLGTNRSQTYHILGAWDGDPARGIISYPAALAQTLLNKKVGDIVEAAGETTPQKFRIDKIEKPPAEMVQSL